jgi:phage terminase small subunit
MGLTKKRQAWLDQYLQCWNATEAARRVGYKHPNTQGPRLLVDVSIAAEIQKRLDEMVMSADEVLRLLSRQANASHKSWVKVDKDGHIYFDFSDPEAQKNIDLIKKIKTKTRTEKAGEKSFEVEWVEVELYDSQRALELIGKHHGIFVDRHEITGKNGEPLLTDDRYDRALSTLADAIRASVLDQGTGADSDVDTPE